MTNVQIDTTGMYFDKPLVLENGVKVYVPSMYDIIQFGEHEYYETIYSLCSIPSDLKGQLYNLGLDYEQVSDFELFSLMLKSANPEVMKILFGDLDYTNFTAVKLKEDDALALFNPKTRMIIKEQDYNKIIKYIRVMHNIVPKPEFGTNAYTKQFLIEEALDQMKVQALKTDKTKPPILLPIISSLINHSGYPYTKTQLMTEVNIYEFMDSGRRVPMIKHASELMMGLYCGKLDGSKLNKADLDWMKDISELKPKKGTTVDIG